MQIRWSSGRIGLKKKISFSCLAVRRPNRPYGQTTPSQKAFGAQCENSVSVQMLSVNTLSVNIIGVSRDIWTQVSGQAEFICENSQGRQGITMALN